MLNEFEELQHKILSHFAGDDFKAELAMAKKEFFDNSGHLDEHAENFEQRMSQFYDWYFFSRELSDYKQTPIEACQLQRGLRLTDEELKTLEVLKNFQHSLYEFIKIKDEDVYLKDLFKNKKIIVKKSQWVYGFDPEEIFEVRLIPVNGSFLFTRGFCFHPETVKKFILSEVKKHQKDADLNPEKLMLRLIKMRYKYEQYKHLSPDMIYSNEGKLGL